MNMQYGREFFLRVLVFALLLQTGIEFGGAERTLFMWVLNATYDCFWFDLCLLAYLEIL